MISACPVEWTVSILNSSFLCVAVIPKHTYAVSESAEDFNPKLMNMVNLLLLGFSWEFFPFLVLCCVAWQVPAE